MDREGGTDAKTELLFRILRDVGLSAQTQLTDKQPALDPWMRAQANRALQAEMLQSLSPHPKPWDWSYCIRLPYFSKESADWVPLLWIDDRKTREVAFQVVVAGGPRRFGYRWEPPEGGASGPSEHGFYHAQPITSVHVKEGQNVSLEVGHDHVNEHFPTFPIDARDGLDLVNAMFVSLYGWRYPEEYIHDAGVLNQVHKSAENCGWARCRNMQASPAKSTGAASTHGAKSNKNKKK